MPELSDIPGYLRYIPNRKTILLFTPKGVNPKDFYPDHDYEPITLDTSEVPIGCDMDQHSVFRIWPAATLWQCAGCGEIMSRRHDEGDTHMAIFTNYTRHGEPYQDTRLCGPVRQQEERPK